MGQQRRLPCEASDAMEDGVGIGVDGTDHGHEIRVPENESRIGVDDEPSVVVDHMGLAVTPDANPRDDIPRQLEIDLGHHDPGFATRSRERYGHEGAHCRAGSRPPRDECLSLAHR